MNQAQAAFLTSTITRTPVDLTDLDEHAQPRLLKPVTHRCKFERGNRLVANSEGKLVPSTARAFIEGPVEINPQDRFSVGKSALTPIAVKPIEDPTTGKIDHVEVSFQ